MSIFEGKHSKKIEQLENHINKIFEKLSTLEKRPSDYEKEAIQSSKKAAEYRNKAQERLNNSVIIFNDLKILHAEILKNSKEISQIKNFLNNEKEESLKSSQLILNRSNEILEKTNNLQEIFDNHPNLENEALNLEELIQTIKEDASKANATYKNILSKRSEINELYREIIGYSDEDEDGEIVEIEGIRDELEKAYSNLTSKSNELENSIHDLNIKGQDQFDVFIAESEEKLVELNNQSKIEYDTINRRIKSLLPSALTAGLSSAFVKKKQEEEQTYSDYKDSFRNGIVSLSLIALIPIGVSIYFLSNGDSLIEVISRTPKIILSVLPLYIPLIWITISANKKVNLSKRLIEEYTHKQVLSMTIEGLSNQINEIEDDVISEELRIQLLKNFLIVSSENPGKLISNYQKSDNPFLNLLEREGNIKNKKKTIKESVENKVGELIDDGVDNLTNKIEESITPEKT